MELGQNFLYLLRRFRGSWSALQIANNKERINLVIILNRCSYPDPGSDIGQLVSLLLEHVQSEVLEPLLPPPCQVLHEDVYAAVLQVHGGLLNTINWKVPQMRISHSYVVSVFQRLG